MTIMADAPDKISREEWTRTYEGMTPEQKFGEFFQNLAIAAAGGRIGMKKVMDAVFLMRDKGAPDPDVAYWTAAEAEKAMDAFYARVKARRRH